MADPLLDKARQATAEYERLNLTRNAVFWAEKAVCLSTGEFNDVYTFASVLYRDGQYRRSVHVLEREQLVAVAQKDFEGAIDRLECAPNNAGVLGQCNEALSPEDEALFAGKQRQLQASVFCLYGTSHQELLNMTAAHSAYAAALQYDPMCYEAWERLTTNSVVDETKEKEICQTVHTSFASELGKDTADDLNFLYSMRLHCKSQTSQPLTPPQLLRDSSDVVACSALQAYTKYDVHTAIESSNHVMERDPLHPFGLIVHLACLVVLEKKNELFVLAHEAVEDFPERASSWYAVGCYYFTVHEFEKARMHFSKATSLDPNFGLAWIAFGHAFGADGIHDQANTCYFSAMKVMPGSHYPLINIALYHSMTNDPVLAMRYLKQAETLVPGDGVLCHEKGTLALQRRDYTTALCYFNKALSVCSSPGRDKPPLSSWEPLMNNIGHCYRLMEEYDKALHYHFLALTLDSSRSSTYTAIGFIYCMKEDFTTGIEHFHKALRINRQDIVAIDMLKKACECFVGDQDCLEKLIGDHPEDSAYEKELAGVSSVTADVKSVEQRSPAVSMSMGDYSFLPRGFKKDGPVFTTPAHRGVSKPVLMAALTSSLSGTPGQAQLADASRRETPNGATPFQVGEDVGHDDSMDIDD